MSHATSSSRGVSESADHHFFGGKSGNACSGTTGFAIFGNIVDYGGVVHLSQMNMVYDNSETSVGSHIKTDVAFPFYGFGCMVEWKKRLGAPQSATYPFNLDVDVLLTPPPPALAFAHVMRTCEGVRTVHARTPRCSHARSHARVCAQCIRAH